MTPTTKNVTKLAGWWLDLFLKNMTNQGNRAGDIVILDEALICVAPGGLYLQWFLYGELVSDGAAEIVMV